MNKKQWKAEHWKWRCYYSKHGSNGFEVCKLMAHKSIFYAIYHSRTGMPDTFRKPIHHFEMALNMELSREACEAKRINDRKG